MAVENSLLDRGPDDGAVRASLFCRVGRDVTFSRYSLGGWTVIEAVGDVDLASAPLMHETLVLTASSRLIFDLSQVTFMDASGLAVLAEALRRSRVTGGIVALAGPDHRLRRLLEITRFDKLLPIFDCLEEATG